MAHHCTVTPPGEVQSSVRPLPGLVQEPYKQAAAAQSLSPPICSSSSTTTRHGQRTPGTGHAADARGQHQGVRKGAAVASSILRDSRPLGAPVDPILATCARRAPRRKSALGLATERPVRPGHGGGGGRLGTRQWVPTHEPTATARDSDRERVCVPKYPQARLNASGPRAPPKTRAHPPSPYESYWHRRGSHSI